MFPGIAVAREIQRRDARSKFCLSERNRELKQESFRRKGFELRTLPIGGIKGLGIGRQLRNLVGMVSGVFKARRILRDFTPDVVIGVGGYASFPMLGAATLGGYPRVDHGAECRSGARESSSRQVGRFRRRYRCAHEAYFGRRAVVTGNPVRPEFKSISPESSHGALHDSDFWRKPGRAVDQQCGDGGAGQSLETGKTACDSFIRRASGNWKK